MKTLDTGHRTPIETPRNACELRPLRGVALPCVASQFDEVRKPPRCAELRYITEVRGAFEGHDGA